MLKSILKKTCFLVGGLLGLVSASNTNVGAQVVQVGNTTTYNNIYSPIAITPYGKNKHYQVLVTAAELQTAGVSASGMLDSLAMNIYEAPSSALPNFSIKLKNVASQTIASYDSVGLVQVYNNSSYTPTAGGWNWYHFQNSFYWDGASSLLIDFCFDSTAVSSNPTTYTGKVYYSSNMSGKVLYNTVTTNCGSYATNEATSIRPNLKFSFHAATACNGAPAVPGIIPVSLNTICDGTQLTLNAVSTDTLSGMGWKWLSSSDNGSTWSTFGTNSNGTQIYPAGNTQVKVQRYCIASSDTVTSSILTIPTNNNTTYATLPYTQSFETWANSCDSLQLPDNNWTSYPSKGVMSFRREDQGASAGWTEDVTPSSYYPVSTIGNHSGRVQTSKGPGDGYFDLHFNGNDGTTAKKLTFDYFNRTGSANYLEIQLSTDGGLTFTTLTTYAQLGVNSAWVSQNLSFNTSSAKSVLRFHAHTISSQSGDYDLGIDNVKLLGGCSGKPNAGSVDSDIVCAGTGVDLHLVNNSQVAGLKYKWQQSTNGINWNAIQNDTLENPNPVITQSTWYRCIVTCIASNESDTTAAKLIIPKSAALCYCSSTSTIPSAFLNIGNVTIVNQQNTTVLNNGVAAPLTLNLAANHHYSNFDTLAPVTFYKDSSYNVYLTFHTANGTNVSPQMGAAAVKVFIDYNHDGAFDLNTEVASTAFKPSGVYYDTFAIQIPQTALLGTTGMRIVAFSAYSAGDTSNVLPCGSYSQGETEDYLVTIFNQNCPATLNAGSLASTSTILCPGYPYTVTNTGFDDSTGSQIVRVWQVSSNGSTFQNVANAGASLSDTFASAVYYRVAAVCSGDTVYSNVLNLSQNQICYCVSYADGGFSGLVDTADIGSFSLSNINVPLTGSHLNNSAATKHYTNNASLGSIALKADSTYTFTLDHIQSNAPHGDAKITIFIDYNNNGVFDIPSERVYSSISTSSTWHKSGTITIPSTVTNNAVVGLRIVLNNDTAANTPSDEGCGIYTSGETEDYLVKFTNNTTGVNNVNGAVKSLTVYPNPALSNEVNLHYNGTLINNAQIKLTDVSGRIIKTIALDKINDNDVVKINISGLAKGIYFVNLMGENGNGVVKLAVQ